MILIAIAFFTVAALLGIYLLSYVLQHKNTPKGVAITHGSIAAMGLIILIIYSILYSPTPLISIAIFILAALGGVYLMYRDIFGKSLPIGLAVGHGLIAMIGFVFLILFVWG